MLPNHGLGSSAWLINRRGPSKPFRPCPPTPSRAATSVRVVEVERVLEADAIKTREEASTSEPGNEEVGYAADMAEDQMSAERLSAIIHGEVQRRRNFAIISHPDAGWTLGASLREP